jgi:predicted GTPase
MMFSTRTIVLTILITLPVLVYLVLGGYALWQTGMFTYTFWLLPGFWLVTWILALIWKPSQPQLKVPPKSAAHFTPRDESAMQIVRSYQEQIDSLSPEQLADPRFYLQQAEKLAQDLSRHYHPKATNPIDSLTVLEVLAAIRLVIDDMERWMLEAVPGSQLVTIRQWKWLQHAPKWAKRIQNTSWAVGVLLNPANVLKYMTSQLTLAPVTQELQTEFLAAVYLRFMRQLGFYLIEMNSGRLRGGADKYRQTFGPFRNEKRGAESVASATLRPESVTVAVIGQVKAGKSSLVNALLGSVQAQSDVLPATSTISRYRYQLPDSESTLTLLDTPGYADAGATKAQLAEVQVAVRNADVVILVMAANSPARQADRQLMDQLKQWYSTQPALKPPPVVICLTHIDLLSPVMEWNPPYDWETPTTRKAESIAAAVEHVQELFSDVTRIVVPVCTDVARGRADSVLDDLLPALTQVLKDGQMSALLRAYHQHLGKDRFRRIARQISKGGKELLKMWIEERLMPPRSSSPSVADEPRPERQ